MAKRWTWVAWSMLAAFQPDAAGQVGLTLGFSAFMIVGAVIVAHRPGNAIGWIFSAAGLLAFTGVLAVEYAFYAYVTRPGSLPGATFAAWYASWPWYPTLALALIFTPLLFPTGRLLSPLGLVGRGGDGGVYHAGRLPAQAGHSHRPSDCEPDRGRLAGESRGQHDRCRPVHHAACSGLAAARSLVLRFRRSRGVERQQLKWFTYAAALLPMFVLADFLPSTGGSLLSAVPIVFLPVAAGIAILRYRLYDIDRLINRTLVYGLLTALLIGVYTGVVLVLGQLFGGVGRDLPSWAVAGATLAVAALFQPARRRIQGIVDRRFNRHKYNAARTVEAFTARLRDEVDLDTHSAELLGVVDQTMQPTTASLWLRPPAQTSSGSSRRPPPKADWEY